MGFRVFCCLVIFSCAALSGLDLRRRLYVRLRSLQAFMEYFRLMKTNISHFGMSLDDITIELDGGKILSEFCTFLRENNHTLNYPICFSHALEKYQKSLLLLDSDASFLCSIVNRTSESDVDGAIEALDYADEQLLMLISTAKEKYETDGRLRLVLSMSFGAAVALLLL